MFTDLMDLVSELSTVNDEKLPIPGGGGVFLGNGAGFIPLLVGCFFFKDLRRFSDLSAISRLGKQEITNL